MSTQVDGLRRFVGSRPRDGWRPSDVPVVVVVGTAGGVGTSTVAALLAAATAQTGRRTLLVDCDEMVGALHRIHNVGIRHGIAALLDPNVAVNDVAVEISSGCTLLPGGEPPSARRVPFDPTARRTVLRRIAQAYPAYDAVVIDARSQLDGMLAAAEAGVRRFLVVGGCSPAGIAASYAVLKTAESRWPGITVDVVFNRHNADVAKASFDRMPRRAALPESLAGIRRHDPE